MPELSDVRLERAKQTAVEQLIGGIVTAAKTVCLYRSGHPIINQIGDRAMSLLQAALGSETTLTFEIKGKDLIINEAALPTTADTTAFAAILHTLGVGQIIFTNRLAREGMLELFKILVLKPDAGTTLTDIQKAVQQIRIDGLQMIFVLSFVVTGEREEENQPPGRLSEEQVAAFLRARTLPDFLLLLLRQNEPLIGKAAETVTALLDAALNRDMSVEKFSEQMPWPAYDPRIRARFDELAAVLRVPPRTRGARRADPAGPRGVERLIAASSLFLDKDLGDLQDHESQNRTSGLAYAFARTHELLERPANERQTKFAVHAYGRLVIELSQGDDLPGLLREFDFWRGLAARPGLAEPLAAMTASVREALSSPAFAARVVRRLASAAPESDEFQKITALMLFVGGETLAHLVDELRRVEDTHARGKLSMLIVAVSKQTGAQPLLDALKDEDAFLVAQIVQILGHLASQDHAKPVAALLGHRNGKVRDAVRKELRRLGGQDARDALAAYAVAAEDLEEAKLAVTTLSLIKDPEVPGKLAELLFSAYEEALRAHVAEAIGRVPSAEGEAALAKASQRTFWEWISGQNHELVRACKAALHEIEEHKRHGAAS